uniref:Uncharacterized protein n=1 Tax=Arundo donax TaxID=35708 RepID=A0A0A9EJ11_ARUDO
MADSCVSVRTWQWSSRLCVMSSRSGRVSGDRRSPTPSAFTLGFFLAPSKSQGAPKSRLPTTMGSTRMRRGPSCPCTSHTQLLISRYVSFSVTFLDLLLVVVDCPELLAAAAVDREETMGAIRNRSVSGTAGRLLQARQG